MTTPPCTECAHCTEIYRDEIATFYWCAFDEEYISEAYALSDIECDAFVQKLDDNETKKSSA